MLATNESYGSVKQKILLLYEIRMRNIGSRKRRRSEHRGRLMRVMLDERCRCRNGWVGRLLIIGVA
jgi:hypothetical protein